MGTGTLYQRIKTIIEQLNRGLVEREEALRLALLCGLSGKSIFFLGPPGVAKSMVARKVSEAFRDAFFFEYLMGRFSTPDELFGPVSIARLKNEDIYTRNTRGFLPDADIVFLDEIWKASPPIQNTLLAALNEKIFRNGDAITKLPLKLFIAASNEIRDEEETRAFWDRFLVRLELRPIGESRAFSALINSTEDSSGQNSVSDGDFSIETSEWEGWIDETSDVALSPDLIHIILELRAKFASDGELYPYISDRRWKQVAELLRASAFFNGRSQAGVVDGYLLPHCLWNRPRHKPLVEEALISALLRWTFDADSGIQNVADAASQLKKQVEEAAFESAEQLQLRPIRYDDEYLKYLPKDKATGNHQGLEYRIWCDDLETLDERGELEFFLYKGDSFLRTELHSCGWKQREQWTIAGAMGEGEIECCEQTVRTAVPRDIPPTEKKKLSSAICALCAKVDASIAGIESRLEELRRQAEEHLFVPRKTIRPIEDAAKRREAELQHILATLLELAESPEVADAP